MMEHVLEVARSSDLLFRDKMATILRLSTMDDFKAEDVGILLVEPGFFLSCTEKACRIFGIKPNSYNKNLRLYGKAAIILSKAAALAHSLKLKEPYKWNLYTTNIEGGIEI